MAGLIAAYVIATSPFPVALGLLLLLGTILMVMFKGDRNDPFDRIPIWLRIAAPHLLALWLAAFLWLGGHTDGALQTIDGICRSLSVIVVFGPLVWLALIIHRRYIAKPQAG